MPGLKIANPKHKGSSGGIGSIFGLAARLNSTLGPRTTLGGRADINGFDLNDLENSSRANLRLRQLFGSLNAPYTLTLESSYRDRLFNGSLGYQTVQSNLGGILAYPVIHLGKTGFNLSYQVSAEDVLANTDRSYLLSPGRSDNLIPLGRLQAAFSLNRGYQIFSGKGLPATATQGLRYTPTPVVPNLVVFVGKSLPFQNQHRTKAKAPTNLTFSPD